MPHCFNPSCIIRLGQPGTGVKGYSGRSILILDPGGD